MVESIQHMKLPTLYARGSKGQLLIWNIEVEGGKYRTITGAEGAKMVTSAWTICEAKNVGRANATTPEEQAQSEAQSKWTNKRDRNNYKEDPKDIHEDDFILCMLAKHFEDRKDKVSYPMMEDRKYNGMRQLVSIVGPRTRKGKEIFSAPHTFKAVEHLFDTFPDLVLDGELYNHDYRYELNKLIKLVKKTKNITAKDLADSEAIVRYYVYDGYGFDYKGETITEDTPCHVRRDALKELLKGIQYVEVVDYAVVNNKEEVYKVYNRYLDEGYEGAILRTWDGNYEHCRGSHRSNNLLKVKPEKDDEGRCIAVNEGTGNWAGAAFTFTIEWNGHTFNASIKNGKYEERVEILKHPEEWVGKLMTFVFIEFTGKGVPGAPKGMPFSPRVDIKNCFKGDR